MREDSEIGVLPALICTKHVRNVALHCERKYRCNTAESRAGCILNALAVDITAAEAAAHLDDASNVGWHCPTNLILMPSFFFAVLT